MRFQVNSSCQSLLTDQDYRQIDLYVTDLEQAFLRVRGNMSYTFDETRLDYSIEPKSWKAPAEITIMNYKGFHSGRVHFVDDASLSKSNTFSLCVEMRHCIDRHSALPEVLGKVVLVISFHVGAGVMKMTRTADDRKSEKKPVELSEMEFHPVKARYRFDQLILPVELHEEVTNALKVIECRDLIYREWGFDEIDPVPRSILNFYGAPGTGKTMCAHAVAHHLGKPLLALNYSEIESKYVGEAPKNLQRAFDVARQQDCVLFFDEADSFLGRRIENVQQGADQALNSLRSQMLILLEEYEGVVIFATNLVSNFDPAFESRILKHLHFQLPNQEARAAILRKMLPSRLPLTHPFSDAELLALNADTEGLSGREIKNAVLEMVLSDARRDAVFSLESLHLALQKAVAQKNQLRAEEKAREEERERKRKERILGKLKEKVSADIDEK